MNQIFLVSRIALSFWRRREPAEKKKKQISVFNVSLFDYVILHLLQMIRERNTWRRFNIGMKSKILQKRLRDCAKVTILTLNAHNWML